MFQSLFQHSVKVFFLLKTRTTFTITSQKKSLLKNFCFKCLKNFIKMKSFNKASSIEVSTIFFVLGIFVLDKDKVSSISVCILEELSFSSEIMLSVSF